ncbi:MAG: Holliday junction resolvase RuvX [Planctomycetes bacterium]|nr:Holliday junction resolvase RuvX [Planctomycetota bacterium]
MSEGRILTIDYGRKRFGLAVSDPLGIAAHGLPTLAVDSPEEALEPIAKVAREKEATLVVIGLPVSLDGEERTAAKEVRSWGGRLAALLKLPVAYEDERLTTAQADWVLDEIGTKRRKRTGQRDRIAAQIILEGYLEKRRQKTGVRRQESEEDG